VPQGRFDPAYLYELTYTAKDPLVLGIGFAATRDINAFFKTKRMTIPASSIRSPARSRPPSPSAFHNRAISCALHQSRF